MSSEARGSFDLDRFVGAQDGVYARAFGELKAGEKRSHWMWFIFPQIAGLGRSAMAQHYAVRDADEARAYLRHTLLGPRLADCTGAVLDWAGRRSAEAIFGSIDRVKFRSSMTLFEAVAEGAAQQLFNRVLGGFYEGERDAATLRLLDTEEGAGGA